MKVIGSVQARLGSTRLPGKVLMNIGKTRIIEQVLERVERSDGTDSTWLTTGDRPENEAITELCRRSGYDHLKGPEENVLKRHLDVAEESGCDILVRITGDCPFVPSWEIDRVVEQHKENNARYTTNNTDSMPIGTAVDVIDVDVLHELWETGADHPVSKLHDSPEDWKVNFTTNENLERYSDVHIAVDTPEDYWSLTDAADAVGTDTKKILEWLSEKKQ